MMRLFLALLLAGCTEPATQVLVVVHKYGITVGPGGDVDELRLTVKSDPSLPDEMHVVQLSNVLCGDVAPESCWQMPVTATLVPGPQQPDDLVVVKVEGLRNSKRVIGDQASTHFVKDVSQRLDFVLYANCLNVDCSVQDQACNYAGMCQTLGPMTFNGEPQLDGPPAYLLPDLLGADFVPPPDLGSRDLTALPDLTPLQDLSTVQDLSALQDLSTLHDFAQAHDFALADLTISDMTITDMTISDMTVMDMSMSDMAATDDMSMALWTNITPSTPPVTNFKAVWGFGSEVFVVGGSAVIEHSTDGGDNWHLDVVVGLGDNLNAVWGDAGGGNVYAAGDHGALLRHQLDDTWASDTTVFTAPVQKDLHGLWADTNSEFFVVGAGFTFGGWNGTSWTELCGQANNTDSFQAISATDPFNFFVAVNNGGAGEVMALQQTICMFAGGDSEADMTCTSGCPLHPIFGPQGNALFGMSTFSGGGYAVGHLGTILSCTNLGCGPMTNSNKQDLFGAWSEPDNSRNFAVGGNGTILFHSPSLGTGWSPESSGTVQQLNGVWGIGGGGTVYAVGNGATILRRN